MKFPKTIRERFPAAFPLEHDRNCNFSAEQNDHHNQGREPPENDS